MPYYLPFPFLLISYNTHHFLYLISVYYYHSEIVKVSPFSFTISNIKLNMSIPPLHNFGQVGTPASLVRPIYDLLSLLFLAERGTLYIYRCDSYLSILQILYLSPLTNVSS